MCLSHTAYSFIIELRLELTDAPLFYRKAIMRSMVSVHQNVLLSATERNPYHHIQYDDQDKSQRNKTGSPFKPGGFLFNFARLASLAAAAAAATVPGYRENRAAETRRTTMIVQKMLGKSILGNDSGLVLAASTETTAPGILLLQCPFVF